MRALRRRLALATGLLMVPVATPAATPAEEALAREIQGLRQSSASDPVAVHELGWPTWRPEEAECRTWDEVAWALVTDNNCVRLEQGQPEGELVDIVNHLYEAAASLGLLTTSPGSTTQEVLEGLAAGFGAAPNTVKCIVKSWVRATLPDGPELKRQLELIDAAADLISLKDAIKGVHTLATRGPSGLGPTAGSQARQGASLLASGATQSRGWLDSLFHAASSLHMARMASTEFQLARARQRLDGCVVKEAAEIYPAAEADALAYVSETRLWAVDVEKQIYCDALTAGALQPTHRVRIGDLAWFERDAVQNYAGVLAERSGAQQRIATTEAELDALVAKLRNAGAAAIEARHSCDESRADSAARQLGRLQGERCLQQAEASLAAGWTVARMRGDLERSVLLWRDFFRTVEDAERGAEALVGQCRFADVRSPFSAAFDAFARRWGGPTIASLRPCWAAPQRSSEWPPDRLERRATERQAEVGELAAAASEALSRSVDARLDCRFGEARSALDEARGLLGEISCPADAPILAGYEVSWERVDRLGGLIDEAQEAARPQLEALEAARGDLLVSLEQELYVAEDPRHAERCAAVQRVLEMVGLGAGFRPPPECPSLGSPEFDDALEAARRRAESANELGRQQLADVVSRGRQAARLCDLTGLDDALVAITALPIVCGAEVTPEVATLENERRRIVADVDGFRARIPVYEQEWASARQACDVAELRAVAHAIAAWSPNACARANLADPDRARLAALEQHTVARADDLAARAAEVNRVLNAKLQVGRGYLRTLEGIDGDPALAVAGAKRITRDAIELVEWFRTFASPDDLPAACFEPALDEIRTLAPQIEHLISQLGGDGGAEAQLEPTLVTVPDLKGQKVTVAAAWLTELGLHPVLPDDPGEGSTVAGLSPPPNSKVPPESPVRVLIRPTDTTSTTVATVLSTTEEPLPCPAGQARSKIDGRCHDLAVPGLDNAAVHGCSGGRVRDRRSGECVCTWGTWDGSRCVDTEAARRVATIAEASRGAECENLLTTIETLGASPDAFQRQRAVAARRQAEAMGCDPGRIEAAVAGSARFGTPGDGTTGSHLGGGGVVGTTGSAGGGAPGAGATDGDDENPCRCVDESGRPYRVGFGMPCEQEITFRDYNSCQCSVVDMDWSQGAQQGVAYLAYHQPAAGSGAAPEVYGVIALPRRIERDREALCTTGPTCLRVIQPGVPFTILGEYASRAEAAEVVRRRCPNPVRTGAF